jgi:hypothetical protein
MTPEETSRLIDAAGGNKAFALLIGIDVLTDTKYASRVSQWRKRGIPPRIQLARAKELAAIKQSATRRGAL